MTSDQHTIRAPLIRLEDVADRLGVNERHIRRLIAERRVPYLKIGHLIRFDPNDIEHWIEKSRIHGPTRTSQKVKFPDCRRRSHPT